MLAQQGYVFWNLFIFFLTYAVPALTSFPSTPFRRELGPDVEAGALQNRLRDMLGGLNFAELFNRGSSEEGEAVQDPALYFEDADAADLALLEEIVRVGI